MGSLTLHVNHAGVSFVLLIFFQLHSIDYIYNNFQLHTKSREMWITVIFLKDNNEICIFVVVVQFDEYKFLMFSKTFFPQTVL